MHLILGLELPWNLTKQKIGVLPDHVLELVYDFSSPWSLAILTVKCKLHEMAASQGRVKRLSSDFKCRMYATV